MSELATDLSADGCHLCIRLSEKLVFEHYRLFRQAYQAAPDTVSLITLDFSQTRHMDSAAIGMLCLLRRHADRHDLRVELIGCRGRVACCLEIFGFLATSSRARNQSDALQQEER